MEVAIQKDPTSLFEGRRGNMNPVLAGVDFEAKD